MSDELFINFDELLLDNDVFDDFQVQKSVSESTKSRFGESLNEDDLESRLAQTRSANSMKKASWAINVFKAWLNERQNSGIINGLHVFKSLEEMTKLDLDSQLQYFIFEARKQDGQKYPSNSLRDLYQGIGYYIKHKLKKNWRLFNDSEFSASRECLNAAMIETNKEKIEPAGSGPATPITEEQEEKLWKDGFLGTDSPKKLLRTLFYMVGKFFGLRGGREQRELEWGKDIKLTQTEMGEVLIYSNKHRKNFRGGLHQKNLQPKIIKAFPCISNPNRCIVNIYKQYASIRPTNGKCDAFYLQTMVNYSHQQWFADSPVGHNTLSTMVKILCEAAGFENGNFVNHSLKKTTGSRLKHLSEAQRKGQTGNRSEAQSQYEILNDQDYQETSSALYGQCSTAINYRLTEKSVEYSGPPHKKMRVEADGNTNKVIITFE